MKAVREAAPEEVKNYYDKWKTVYSFPEQLVFINEAAKDDQAAFRQYAQSKSPYI